MGPGWSGSVPVQLVLFNSYILNTFLYDKNLAWALSFILNKIYEIFTPLIPKPWSRVCLFGPGLVPGQLLRTKAHDIIKLCHVLQVWYVWNKKNKSINGEYQLLCDRKLRIAWHRQNQKSWSWVRVRWHGPIFHLHIINILKMKTNTYMHFEEESIIYIWSKFQLDTCMFDGNILLTKFGPGFWSRVPGVGPGFYSFPKKTVQEDPCLIYLRGNWP